LSGGDYSSLNSIKIKAYKRAYDIIGNPAIHDPQCRQSADHSMSYIIATLLRKAFEKHEILSTEEGLTREETWKHLMLLPVDYSEKAIFNEATREIMSKIQFEHGGEEYDAGYP